MEKIKCFMCNSESQRDIDNNTDSAIYECDYCGKYTVTKTFLDDYRDDKNFKDKVDQTKYIIAGYLEESNGNRNDSFYIGSDNYFKILEEIDIPKTPIQKLEQLLIYCYKKNEYIGQAFVTRKVFIQNKNSYGKNRYMLNSGYGRIGVAFTRDKYELDGIISAMSGLGWVLPDYNPTGELICFVITAQGLYHAELLLNTNIDSNKVFIAMAFKDDYKGKCETAIKPACARCGFEAQKVDDEHYNGNIVDRIIVKIKRSKFVIADYTYDNSGAYYEAGYADGMGLHVIECCEKDWFDKPDNKVHLDKRNNNLILYKDNKDLEIQLVERIRATISGAKLND